jgi:hypothetical protein
VWYGLGEQYGRLAMMNYHDLDESTRTIMLEEIENDINSKFISNYYGERLLPNHYERFNEELLNAANMYDDGYLVSKFPMTCFKEYELRKGKSAKVPNIANSLLASRVFSIYYLRAVCIRAIKENKPIEWYRARESSNPRSETEAMIGTLANPIEMLEILKSEKPNLPFLNSGALFKLITR